MKDNQIASKGYKYKFSVIVPIYNVEDYLEETLESVINQTIGFEKNIQLILVNDGSPDNSEEICLKYKNKYPNNVVYIKQKNSGVSAARNNGLKYAEGELVNFFDSDDIWDKHTFKDVYKNYKKNRNIKIFSCKLIFFDARKGNHPLNYKYSKNKVVNVAEEYDYPQLSASSVFFSLDLIKKYQFPQEIKYSEDSRLINEILLDEKNIMMLKKPKYYYRRRNDGSSAIQNQVKNLDWYLSTPINVYKYLYNLSEKKYNKVLKYIQYVIMYDIKWRLVYNSTFSPLNALQRKTYSDSLIYLIKKTDDDVILSHKHLNLNEKLFLLKLKYDKKEKDMISITSENVLINEASIDINKLNFLQIDRVYLNDATLKFYGKINLKYISKKEFNIILDDKNIEVKYYKLASKSNNESFNGEDIYEYSGIEFNVPLDKENWKLSFKIGKINISPNFGIGAIFSKLLPRSYHHFKDRTLVLKNGSIYNNKKNIFKSIFYEVANDVNLLLKRKIKSLIIRLYTKISRLFKRKEIWLISDRVNRADDNGEHFFRYMIDNHPEKNIYFILSSSSIDYERIKKIGKVLDPNSIKYKLIFNNADVVASAHAENYIFNPLGRSGAYVRDQYYFKFIFLQHGITKDDLSPWLNINTKRIDMFVTACTKEYNSILEGNYNYGKDIVKLTGFSRFDNLLKMKKKTKLKNKIMFSLTWRSSLSVGINKENGERIYNPEFKNSDYYKFINRVFNDKKLLKVLDEKGYKIRFIPHPNVMPQIKDFDLNDFIEIETKNINYQKEFCENKLLVTDYSSVFFDFAYLKKPVIYYQADRDSFYEGQVYQQGYFDYNKMAFGPCLTDHDEFIDNLIKIINNDCKIEKKYLNRIEKTFKFNDDKNCERIYNEIVKKMTEL